MHKYLEHNCFYRICFLKAATIKLCLAVTFTSGSIVSSNLYVFYIHLEGKHSKRWPCVSDTKLKARSLFSSTALFEHLLAFSIASNIDRVYVLAIQRIVILHHLVKYLKWPDFFPIAKEGSGDVIVKRFVFKTQKF